jgi:hypothetical protein
VSNVKTKKKKTQAWVQVVVAIVKLFSMPKVAHDAQKSKPSLDFFSLF